MVKMRCQRGAVQGIAEHNGLQTRDGRADVTLVEWLSQTKGRSGSDQRLDLSCIICGWLSPECAIAESASLPVAGHQKAQI